MGVMIEQVFVICVFLTDIVKNGSKTQMLPSNPPHDLSCVIYLFIQACGWAILLTKYSHPPPHNNLSLYMII